MQDRVAVHPVMDERGGRRIAVYRRAGGGYVYVEEARFFEVGDSESSWEEVFDHDTRSGIYDSVETALREAERDVPWLNRRLRRGGNSGS